MAHHIGKFENIFDEGSARVFKPVTQPMAVSEFRPVSHCLLRETFDQVMPISPSDDSEDVALFDFVH